LTWCSTCPVSAQHPVPGYLLANGIESNGRVLGLVFPGQPNLGAADGDNVDSRVQLQGLPDLIMFPNRVINDPTLTRWG
jgi:hypothetical protein